MSSISLYLPLSSSISFYPLHLPRLLSKIFKNKSVKFLTKLFFILERKLDFGDKENALEKQKSRLYFSKT
jgi:hypothetical protein